MPITQSRLLALVEASEEHQRSYASICEVAKSIAMRYPEANMESQPFSELFAAIFAFGPSASATQRILAERQHYNLTSRKNERKAEHARRKRQADQAGTTPKEVVEYLDLINVDGDPQT